MFDEFNLKEVCILFRAQKILWQGIAYTVPADWRAQYAAPKAKPQPDRVNPHVPILTAIKEQQLFSGVEGEG